MIMINIILGIKEEMVKPYNDETNSCFRRGPISSNLTFKIMIDAIRPIVKNQKAT
jgi:hypothetical protein